METQGLDIIPDPPLLPFDATQTSLAFFPLGFLVLFPLFLFFSTSLWPAHLCAPSISSLPPPLVSAS